MCIRTVRLVHTVSLIPKLVQSDLAQTQACKRALLSIDLCIQSLVSLLATLKSCFVPSSYKSINLLSTIVYNVFIYESECYIKTIICLVLLNYIFYVSIIECCFFKYTVIRFKTYLGSYILHCLVTKCTICDINNNL